MKKVILFFITITLIVFGSFLSKTFAYTDEFILLLETMDIPKENILGRKINEEIYNEYKLFVYGNPLENHNGQRWKNVEKGKWTQNAGAWNGKGVRGEYWILGTNYNGKDVHNHMFPVDIEPPTEPTTWRYAVIPDALESWQETEKYMDDIQKEYMITQNLMRNNIAYELTVKDIGFEKVRVENYATWKTKGSVYTQRYDGNNKRWAANFMIPPMAGDAELEGYANFPFGTEYEMSEESDISIPIVYGSQVINLTDYAKKEHVKEIKSQLYINGILIDEINDTGALAVNKEKVYDVKRSDYQINSLIVLNIEIKSTLFTTFITDGALTDVKNYTLYVKYGEVVEENEPSINNKVSNEYYREYETIPPPQITSIEITRIVNGEEVPLLVSEKTGKKFVCAGQTINIKVKAINWPWHCILEIDGDTSISTFDELTKRFEWTEPKSRNQKTLLNSLKEYKNMYKEEKYMQCLKIGNEEEEFIYTYVIPYKTKQTLHSWSTLREISNDAFNINEEDLFTRVGEPYELVFKVNGQTGTSTTRVELDVFERWDTLYNRDLSKHIKK